MLLVRVYVDLGLCPPFDPAAVRARLAHAPRRGALPRTPARALCGGAGARARRHPRSALTARCWSHAGIVTSAAGSAHHRPRLRSPRAACSRMRSTAIPPSRRASGRGVFSGREVSRELAPLPPGNSQVQTPQYTGVQMQAASSALPVPIVVGHDAGSRRTSCGPADFLASPQYSQSSGGKGGVFGGGNSQVTGYEYFTALVFGLCGRPDHQRRYGYDGQDTYSLYQLNCGIIKGTTPQTPWSYLTANHSKRALAYPGTALVVSPSYDLGSSSSVGTLSFEVVGTYSGTSVTSTDADPAQILGDFLTNGQYGVGFPAASIDATTLYGGSGGASYQVYCAAIGIGLSPALTDQEGRELDPRALAAAHQFHRGLVRRQTEDRPLRRCAGDGDAGRGHQRDLRAGDDAGLRPLGRRLHRRHRRRPRHHHTLRPLRHAERRQPRGSEPRADRRRRADHDAAELLCADPGAGARPERDRALRPTDRPDRHRARNLHRRDRPDRRAADPPTCALRAQHLRLQALVGMLPARADGHRHAHRRQSRARQDPGAYPRDRRGWQRPAVGDRGGISGRDRYDARLRGRRLDQRGHRLAQRRPRRRSTRRSSSSRRRT